MLTNKSPQKVKKAGNLLDIMLVDYLIFTPETYYSFADDGVYSVKNIIQALNVFFSPIPQNL